MKVFRGSTLLPRPAFFSHFLQSPAATLTYPFTPGNTALLTHRPVIAGWRPAPAIFRRQLRSGFQMVLPGDFQPPPLRFGRPLCRQ